MSDPLLNELNTTTLYSIYPDVLEDNYFRNAPLLMAIRNSKAYVPWDDGPYSQVTFAYRGTVGAWFTSGATFNTGKVPMLGSMNFVPRFVYDNVTEDLIEVDVFNRGRGKVFDLVDTHLALALNTINARVDIGLYRHGQASSAQVLDDRSAFTNGLTEAYNDGVTMSWDGNIYPLYGGATRQASVYNPTSNTLSSIPYFVGGQISYSILLDNYLRCCRGNDHPDLAVMNKPAFGYCIEKLQPQQRFAQEPEPHWGFQSFKFMGMRLIIDDYAPSHAITATPPGEGVNDGNIGNYSTSASVTLQGSPSGGSNLTGAGPFDAGEVIFMVNTNHLLMRIPVSPLWQFGFTGFMRPPDSLRLSGQILAGATIYTGAPWSGKILWGILG